MSTRVADLADVVRKHRVWSAVAGVTLAGIALAAGAVVNGWKRISPDRSEQLSGSVARKRSGDQVMPVAQNTRRVPPGYQTFDEFAGQSPAVQRALEMQAAADAAGTKVARRSLRSERTGPRVLNEDVKVRVIEDDDVQVPVRRI